VSKSVNLYGQMGNPNKNPGNLNKNLEKPNLKSAKFKQKKQLISEIQT
jgi:hypothetical protein